MGEHPCWLGVISKWVSEVIKAKSRNIIVFSPLWNCWSVLLDDTSSFAAELIGSLRLSTVEWQCVWSVVLCIFLYVSRLSSVLFYCNFYGPCVWNTCKRRWWWCYQTYRPIAGNVLLYNHQFVQQKLLNSNHLRRKLIQTHIQKVMDACKPHVFLLWRLLAPIFSLQLWAVPIKHCQLRLSPQYKRSWNRIPVNQQTEDIWSFGGN